MAGFVGCLFTRKFKMQSACRHQSKRHGSRIHFIYDHTLFMFRKYYPLKVDRIAKSIPSRFRVLSKNAFAIISFRRPSVLTNAIYFKVLTKFDKMPFILRFCAKCFDKILFIWRFLQKCVDKIPLFILTTAFCKKKKPFNSWFGQVCWQNTHYF